MQSFIYTLLICSVTMSAISILLMLLSPVLSKRYSAKWQYYTWLVIVIGLVIPFRPDFNFGLFTINIPIIQNDIPDTQVTEKTVEQENIDIVTPSLPNENNEKAVNIMTASVYEKIFAVWIIGMSVTLIYNLFKHYRVIRIITRWKENVTDTRTLDILQRQKELLGIKQNISIQICPMIFGSILAGIIKPAVLLRTTKYSDEELLFIIRHELIHFKRKDLIFKILLLTAKAIHWFNPVIYLIVRAVSVQCEKSCDEAVIGNADSVVRQKYALFIIAAAQSKSEAETALTTNFYGSKYNMKSRLLSIMDRSKKKTGILIVCAAFIFTLCTSLILAGNIVVPEEPVSESSESLKSSEIPDLSEDIIPYSAESDDYFENMRVMINVKGIDGTYITSMMASIIGMGDLNMPMKALMISEGEYIPVMISIK